MSTFSEAERLMRMCVDDAGDPPAAPSPELSSYIGLAQVCATLAVASELRRSNEARDDFYREVVGTLKAIREVEA